MRVGKVQRVTKETEILVEINMDLKNQSIIESGIGFLDHMLQLFCFHGNFTLKLCCNGDLNVDSHHTVEDIGIAIGTAIKEALGDNKGIKRYSSLSIPMDEALCNIALDISNRAYLVFNVNFKRENIGSIATEDFREFFRALVGSCGLTLHIDVPYGENDHHKIESVFKAFGRALREAVEITSKEIPSSKGVL